jgi:hypothetical protein
MRPRLVALIVASERSSRPASACWRDHNRANHQRTGSTGVRSGVAGALCERDPALPFGCESERRLDTGYSIVPNMQKPTIGESSFRRAAVIAAPSAVRLNCAETERARVTGACKISANDRAEAEVCPSLKLSPATDESRNTGEVDRPLLLLSVAEVVPTTSESLTVDGVLRVGGREGVDGCARSRCGRSRLLMDAGPGS